MTDTTGRARYSEVAAALEAVPVKQPGRTVDLLARMLDLTDTDVHKRTGRRISRATVNAKRTGRSPVRPEDLWPLADAIGVEVEVLLLQPTDAARWLLDHRGPEINGPDDDGALSHCSSEQRCTASTLTYLLYRDILSGSGQAVAQAA